MKKLNVLPQNPEEGIGRFPSWLHRSLPKGATLLQTQGVVSKNRLYTVCEEAKCPNLLECWSHKTATFLAMGKECTRNCGFCAIDFAKTPQKLDPEEPKRIADSVKELDLKHVVITMVARDDLADGGAEHLAHIVQTVREVCPKTTVELLTSDFQENLQAIDTVILANPDVFNHNIETVRSLTPRVRHRATYERTLSVLKHVKENAPSIVTKSGLMVGLGEKEEEVFETLRDLKEVGVSIVTLGQYLQANTKKLLVKSFVHPNTFKKYEVFGLSIGLKQVFAGPFVRSSYHAGEVFHVQRG